ncbi:LptF/LptG family permease [Candidatus Pelagibacter sp.]|jgi:lipopolysaccharide export system permease protein|nr:LptF/LptG family permease [Candidatus Pelagibacter sp.]
MKTFQFYLVKLFTKRLFLTSGIFLALIFILSIFEEISFFKKSEVSLLFPYLIALLNTPSALFELFPFIFLIATQFFFIYLIKKGELDVLKISGLTNLYIIRLLTLVSFIVGILIIIIYYSFSSKLKFLYLDLKNAYSNDNKYLATVTKNGLWIKDEVDNQTYIVNANIIDKNYLKSVSIFKFDSDFKLKEVMISPKVDVSNNLWVISNPIITIENQSITYENDIIMKSNFDQKKINTLFDNLSSLSISELMKQRNDFTQLGYSTIEIETYMHRLVSFPFFLSIMTLLSSVIMLNIKKNKSLIFHIVLGIALSVIIYYSSYLFNLLGENEKIPNILATWFPLFIILVFITIGLIRINEK